MSARSRLSRWAKRCALAAALYLLLSFFGAWIFTHPPGASHPRDVAQPFGARYRARTVILPPARAGQPELEAWYLPGRSSHGAVLLLHGYRESRAQMAGLARRLAEETRHALLVPDFRGCGGSERRAATAGIAEGEDVRTALAFLRREGFEPGRTVVIGFSMGAVAALRAAARPEAGDWAALVLISPYDSLEAAIDARTRHYSLLPARPFFVPLIRFGEWLAGIDLVGVDLVAEARRVRAKRRLVIAQSDDWRAPLPGVRRVAEALRAPIRIYAGDDHRVLWGAHRESVERRCARAVREALGPPD